MRILVVDDDDLLARAIARGLVAEGFAVDVTGKGDEAVWLATENPYDAIVLDLMLPGLDGHQVCEQLRAAGNETPILMLTAKVGARDEVHALDSGADDFLTKPFSFMVLLARLRALVRRGAGRRSPVLRVGDLRLDPARHDVRRGDTPIDLTPRQFALLEYLMRRAGEVVSKREIVEHVWDFAFDGPHNIVEVYVRQLRERVDRPFGRASIQTVRLVGYRLAEDPG